MEGGVARKVPETSPLEVLFMNVNRGVVFSDSLWLHCTHSREHLLFQPCPSAPHFAIFLHTPTHQQQLLFIPPILVRGLTLCQAFHLSNSI